MIEKFYIMNLVLEKIQYEESNRNTCDDLKVIVLLLDLKISYTIDLFLSLKTWLHQVLQFVVSFFGSDQQR